MKRFKESKFSLKMIDADFNVVVLADGAFPINRKFWNYLPKLKKLFAVMVLPVSCFTLEEHLIMLWVTWIVYPTKNKKCRILI